MRLAIVGGGISGLVTALLAATHGHDVTVVDRDVDPPLGGPEDLARWERRGVPQAHFAHYFSARATSVLQRETPEVLAALRNAGTVWTELDFGPTAPGIGAIASRRPVYEATLRAHVRAQSGVTFVSGTRVVGLLADADAGGTATVRGVRLEDGTEIEADLVIDAGGRRSGSDRWLEELGVGPLPVDDHPVRVHYFSRHYRLHDGEDYPSRAVPLDVWLSYAEFLVFLGDNGTFSVCGIVASSDPLRGRLRDGEVFDALLSAVPPLDTWMQRSSPVSPVYLMAGLSNRRRSLLRGGAPPVSGFLPVGDAAIYTNPTRGQGVGLSVWMADHLVDLLDRAPDPTAAAIAQERFIDELLEDRFALQIRVDDDNDAQFEAGARGEGWLDLAMHPDDAFMRAAWMAAREDPDIAWRVNRVAHMLDPTRALRDHAPTRAAIETRLAAGSKLEPPPDALSRRDFEALVGG